MKRRNSKMVPGINGFDPIDRAAHGQGGGFRRAGHAGKRDCAGPLPRPRHAARPSPSSRSRATLSAFRSACTTPGPFLESGVVFRFAFTRPAALIFPAQGYRGKDTIAESTEMPVRSRLGLDLNYVPRDLAIFDCKHLTDVRFRHAVLLGQPPYALSVFVGDHGLHPILQKSESNSYAIGSNSSSVHCGG